jgi:hypothetical protein
MSANSIQSPYKIFTDVDGKPLQNGYIYIGTANQNPETNAISVYWDQDLTIPAAQPIRTVGGYPSRHGSPAVIYANTADYSITVRDQMGALVFSSLVTTESISSALISFIQAGTGAVATDVQTKLRELVSTYDYMTAAEIADVQSGIPTLNVAVALQKAIDAAAAANKGLLWLPGVYGVTAEITAPSMAYQTWECLGYVKLKWTGSTDATKSVIRATAANGAQWAHNRIFGLNIDADFKAGFCFTIEGTAGGIYTATNNRFTDVLMESATVANLLIGDNGEPFVVDVDGSANLFDHCTFYNAPYNVKINALNAVDNVFTNRCVFGSNVTDLVIQHIRVVRGVNTVLENPEFGTLGNYTNDDCVCVYAKNALHMRSIYMEESRLLLVEDSANYTDMTYIVDGVHVNDSRNDANLNRRYFIRQTSGGRTLSLSNAQIGIGGALCPIRLLYWTGPLNANNVDMDDGHLLTEPVAGFTNPQWSVDGNTPWTTVSLTKNWDLSRWLYSVALPTGDTPAVWAQSPGAGATMTCQGVATNARYGARTAELIVSVAGTTLSGLTTTISKNGYVTVVFSGKSSSQSVLPKISIDGTELTTKVSWDEAAGLNGTRFIAWAEKDIRANSNGSAVIRVGIAANLTGTMHVDTIVTLPFQVRSGMAPAFIAVKPDDRPGVYYGPTVPTWGPWEVGDRIYNSVPTVGQPKSWVCTAAGSPGTQVSEGNL